MIRRYNGLNGPGQDAVRAAQGMIGNPSLSDTAWPYWWEHPRQNAEIVQRVNSIVAPPNGASTVVVTLEVPAGFRFVLKAIRQTFQTNITTPPPFIDGSGDILWTIDVDTPANAPALSGYPIADLANMADQRGSQERPWPIYGYSVFSPYQTLRYKVITTAAITPGAPNFITCGLFGWWEKAQ